MKKIKTIYKALVILLIFSACTEERSLDFLENVAPPSNVAATYTLTQDNSGFVTITPTAQGAVGFNIDLGDSSSEVQGLEMGKIVQHTYAEGTYNLTITAYNSKGDETQVSQELIVSFNAPENLTVTLENDPGVSKQVNISATADFAVTYEFYSGETDVDQPVMTANIGDAINYQYAEPGIYSLEIIAKGSAIATTSFTQDFEVTEISSPLNSAGTPPNRGPLDVISIYGIAYENVADTDAFPNWDQGSQGSSWAEFDLNGDLMLQYINLSYQGIQFGSAQDVSNMEYLHLDVWTKDVNRIETSLISQTNGEKPVWTDLTLDEWTSIDIPISAFTDQGLTVADIHQLKLVGDPWAAGSVFVDNIYFWKTPSAPSVLAGTWRIATEAGSLKVGPSPGSGDWWSIDDAGVTARACYYDDEYVFGTDFTFQNVLGANTWLEGWQGSNPESCGIPVAPFDGNAGATFVHDATNNKVTFSGSGAYLGLPKVNNIGEIPNVAVQTTITYDITLSNNDTEMEVIIEAGSGVFWTYKMVKDTNITTSPIDGTWKIAEEAGSLKVGPSLGSGEWWSIDDAGVSARACYYNDEYVFEPGGTFKNILGTDTWLEGWQGGNSDVCGAPIAPFDGNANATFALDSSNNQLTINGKGAYLGLPKVNNTGELSNPDDAPDSVTYDFVLSNNDTEMIINIEAGSGVFWSYKLIKQ